MRERVYDWESDGGMKSLTKRKYVIATYKRNLTNVIATPFVDSS